MRAENNNMTGKEFTERIDFCLKKRNQTRKALAVDLGISSSTISSWAAGRGSIPNANIVAQIADYLNVSNDWLITGNDFVQKQNLSPEILELAEDIFKLPAEYQQIIKANVEAYKALCFKLEKASSQNII